jgi:hypothetical protein
VAAWIGLASRCLGTRTFYADALDLLQSKRSRCTRVCAFAADGIGDSEAAAAAASRALETLTAGVRGYLDGRRSGRRLDPRALERTVSRRFAPGPPDAGAAGTTVVGATTDGARVCVLWAGDSRAYVIDQAGVLVPLTVDDLDADDRLVRYCGADGRLMGGLHAGVWRGRVGGILVCTDGVHQTCGPAELQEFVQWCVRNGVSDSAAFSSSLAEFLGENVSDNYSAGLWYRRVMTTVLRRRRAAAG